VRRGGRFVDGLAVHQATPRRWTAAEAEVIRTAVAHCWESLQPAHALRELRTSERRDRQLAHEEHEVAAALQRTLLPRELPALARLSAAANYLSAAFGAAGGDWYDVLPSPAPWSPWPWATSSGRDRPPPRAPCPTTCSPTCSSPSIRGTWRPPPADNRHRGRGLQIIRQLADDVTITTSTGGTDIEFTVPHTGAAPPKPRSSGSSTTRSP
jgi:hypothetical protein